MAFYLSLFVGLSLLSIVSVFERRAAKVAGVLCAVVVALLAYRKAYVGTDTWSYVLISEQVESGLSEDLPVEAGYILLVNVALFLTETPLASVSILAALSAILAAGAFAMLPHQVAIPLVPLYVTYFLVDNAFNGLRLGIATGLCLIGAAVYLRGWRVVAILTVILAVSVQFTSVLLPALFLVRGMWKRRTLVIPLVVLTAVTLFYFSARIEEKYLLYSADEVDKGWSGVSMLVLALILLAIAFSARQLSRFQLFLAAAIALCAIPNDFGLLTVRIAQLLLLYLAFDMGLRAELGGRGNDQSGAGQSLDSQAIHNRTYATVAGRNAIEVTLLLVLTITAAFFRFRNIITVSPEELSPYVPYVTR